MNERLKKLRKTLDLTQQEFADRIRVKRNTVATYEMGRSGISDAAISLICKEFNVREDWLRNGTGEMFLELDKEDLLMEWAGRVLASDSSDFRKRFVTVLMSLNEDEWEMIERRTKELFELDYEDGNFKHKKMR